jgi:quercetin dioxygenase-like cupin family protein
MICVSVVFFLAFGFSQQAPEAAPTGTMIEKMMVANPGELKWESDPKSPDSSQSVVLREDPATGATELFVRYPAGHCFPPHWHTGNERLILFEGRMSIQIGKEQQYLESGGFAYLPAKQIQRMSCVSQTRCAFYVYWDAKLDFNPVKE